VDGRAPQLHPLVHWSGLAARRASRALRGRRLRLGDAPDRWRATLLRSWFLGGHQSLCDAANVDCSKVCRENYTGIETKCDTGAPLL